MKSTHRLFASAEDVTKPGENIEWGVLCRRKGTHRLTCILHTPGLFGDGQERHLGSWNLGWKERRRRAYNGHQDVRQPGLNQQSIVGWQAMLEWEEPRLYDPFGG
jgi:hypothetical protein